MAIVTETIRVVVTGANPKTVTFSVPVNTATGASVNPLTIPLSGVNAGTDTIQAFMDSHTLSSNQSTLVWQSVNSPIANGTFTIDAYANNASKRGWPGGLFTGASTFGRTFPFLNAAPGANSLVFNQEIPNYPINGFNNQPTNAGAGGGYKLCPMVVVQQTSTGTFSSSLPITGTSDGAGGKADNGNSHAGYLLNFYGNLVVKTAGTYTFYMTNANVSSAAFWIKGATVSSVQGPNTADASTGAFPATSPKNGYSPLAVVSTNNAEKSLYTASYVTFPAPGTYPFEGVYNQFFEQQFSGDNNSYFQITYLAGTQALPSNQNSSPTSGAVQPFPVTIVNPPPAGVTPTGALRLTPVGGATNLVTQGASVNLTLTIQGVTYSSIPYVPLLEGTVGFLTITNNGSQFVFPTYNGAVVNSSLAAGNIFSVTANNSAIAGVFAIASGTNPAPYFLVYTGGPFQFATPGAQVSSSNVSVTAGDIAWYDGNNGSFDVYNGSGFIQFTFDVDYMVRPAVASVSPTTLTANGKAQAVQINLTKPMSPQQQGLFGTGNTVNISGSVTGGATLGAFSAILDSGGFLQGWSTTITPPLSSTNGSVSLNITVQGTLTFLNGNTFVTQNVVYINGTAATIQTAGGGFVPPVGVSLTTNPTATALSSTAPTTVIGTFYTHDNPSSCTVVFFKKFITGGAQQTLGTTSTPTSAITTTVGGQTVFQKTYQFAASFPTITVTTSTQANINLGFTVTDNTSGLSTTYQSTTTYFENFSIFKPIGGGGACPAVDMFVDDWHQVSEMKVGFGVNTLTGDVSEYAAALPQTEDVGIQAIDFSMQPCFRLLAANGCEVIVSGSTPIPTLETIERHEAGLPIEPLVEDVRVGMHVITEIDMDAPGDRMEWSPLVEVEYVGERQVARVYCGGRNFAAGSKPGKYIYTHNAFIGK